MKTILIFAFLISIVLADEYAAQVIKCNFDQRDPDNCSSEEDLVIGVYKCNYYSIFTTRCNACSTYSINKYYKLERCGSEFHPDGVTCSEEYVPVCGYTYDHTMVNRTNVCIACNGDKRQEFYIKGTCPPLFGVH